MRAFTKEEASTMYTSCDNAVCLSTKCMHWKWIRITSVCHDAGLRLWDDPEVYGKKWFCSECDVEIFTPDQLIYKGRCSLTKL